MKQRGDLRNKIVMVTVLVIFLAAVASEISAQGDQVVAVAACFGPGGIVTCANCQSVLVLYWKKDG